MRFPYQAYPLDPPDLLTGTRYLYRPVIPVALSYRGRNMGGAYLQGLVDSGADWCLFHAVLGQLIGIPIREGVQQDFQGVEGIWSPAYFHEVEMEIGPFRVKAFAGFVEDWKFPFSILGHLGFFDQFVVTLHCGQNNRYVDVMRP